MDAPERLAGDQRAVLALVLGQGRSYGEIAGTLSIAPDEVRARARAALDALGPPTTVPDADRARIADYLLGQLPASVGDQVRDGLAASADQRAWAGVVRNELGPLSASPLPAIPDGPTASAATPATPTPHSSRTGGIVLLSVLAAAIVAAIVIFVIKPGGGSGNHRDPSATVARVASGQSSTSPNASASASSTTSSSQSATIVGQIKLTPPTGGGQTKGIALVLQQGSLKGLGIEAVHVPPTTTKPRTTYAVWLYNSPADAIRLGYFSKGVSKQGELGSTAELPANAAHYKYLIVTLETGVKPSKTPGAVLLKGSLSAIAKSKL